MTSNEYFTKEALALKPLYAQMIDDVKDYAYKGLMPFCIQWGEFYPIEKNSGIMFYGRATNGWITFESDVEKLFDKNSKDCIFALDDQMQWVEDCAGGKEEYYNSNRSAFWRIIRSVASNFYPGGDELLNICWSNVCKIAPDASNPSDGLFYAQFPAARTIMQREIEIFSPKHVVLLTGVRWCRDFLYFLNGNMHTKSVASYRWGNKGEYAVKVYKIGDVFYYVSEHPQGKEEGTHIDVLIEAISQNS